MWIFRWSDKYETWRGSAFDNIFGLSLHHNNKITKFSAIHTFVSVQMVYSTFFYFWYIEKNAIQCWNMKNEGSPSSISSTHTIFDAFENGNHYYHYTHSQQSIVNSIASTYCATLSLSLFMVSFRICGYICKCHIASI